MQERVAIPGFQNARRFCASDACPRPYLALYYTDSLAVFTNPAYATAFTNQTDWSQRNFTRMRGTQRRVGRLTVEAGSGEGGALALFVVPQAKLAEPDSRVRLALALQSMVGEDHVIRASLIETDSGRPTPVTADAQPSPSDALVMAEATRTHVALLHARAVSRTLDLPGDDVYPFQTLWRLGC